MNYITIKELEEKVNNLSKEKLAYLKVMEANVSYPQANVNVKLSGFVSAYSYVLKQYEGWNKKNNLNDYLQGSKKYFKKILELFNKFISNDFRVYRHNYNNDKDAGTEGIILLREQMYNEEYIFTYDAPVTQFLKGLHKRDESKIHKAINYLAGEEIEIIDSTDFFFLQELYEFRRNENNYIKRSEAEKKSLHTIRNEFEALLIKAENKLINFEGNSTEKFESWFSNERQEYKKWLKNSITSFEDFDKKSNKTIQDYELLYGEKLKLEKPADYWQKRAVKLKKEGKQWLYGVILTSIVAVALLFVVLLYISTDTFKDLFKDTGTAIRWSIVFIAFISFFAFGIRTFAKLMFSSYHLARDAEEREQLAYVYLALINDKNIDEKERHLVLQSLFSRSDSGLLKSDTSPTMPGNILDKLSK